MYEDICTHARTQTHHHRNGLRQQVAYNYYDSSTLPPSSTTNHDITDDLLRAQTISTPTSSQFALLCSALSCPVSRKSTFTPPEHVHPSVPADHPRPSCNSALLPIGCFALLPTDTPSTLCTLQVLSYNCQQKTKQYGSSAFPIVLPYAYALAVIIRDNRVKENQHRKILQPWSRFPRQKSSKSSALLQYPLFACITPTTLSRRLVQVQIPSLLGNLPPCVAQPTRPLPPPFRPPGMLPLCRTVLELLRHCLVTIRGPNRRPLWHHHPWVVLSRCLG